MLPQVKSSVDYDKIPQRTHKYPASDKAKNVYRQLGLKLQTKETT